ncbi:MAG: ABC transporter permease subunit [Kiritimatiellia bacterium]
MKIFPKIKLSPLTAKRLKNFMRIRCAKWALRILCGLYIISLFSELICNSRPLLLHCEGRTFFPFLNNPTMQELTGTESETVKVDYKKFTSSPAFTTNSSNFVIWAPVRFSPGDTTDSQSLSSYQTVTVHIVPRFFAASFNLLPDKRLVRCIGCSHFFPEGYDFQNDTFSDHWNVPPEIKTAVRERFTNRYSERVETIISHKTQSGFTAKATMPEFRPARTTPKTVRVSMRQVQQAESPLHIRFRQKPGMFYPLDKKDWNRIPLEKQQTIIGLVKKSFTGEAAAAVLNWKDRKADITCILNEIAWPYPPVKEHIMGIDSAGRDVFAQVLYALRISMTFGLILSVWAMFLGMIAGAIQGYFGGKIDICGQRLTEIWSAMPFLYIMILAGAILGRSFMLLLICYGLFNWLATSYYMRAEFLRLRKQTFVEAALCQGLSSIRIIFSHILPNAITPMITLLPFTLAGAIGALAALDFLGFGLPPLTPSWGQLIQQAQLFRWAWWLILFPSLALVTVIMLTVIIGEGLRDAFDPKQQSRME